LISSLIAELIPLTSASVLTAFLDALVVACVQSSLAKLSRSTVSIRIIVGIVVATITVAIVVTPIAIRFALTTSLFTFPFTLTPGLFPLPVWILSLRLRSRTSRHSNTKKER
jgi:hypothetical protein